MIIVEASHINNGGSFVLLKYLLKELERRQVCSVVYVKYEHVYKDLLVYPFHYVKIEKTSTLLTLFRYAERRTNVLFFCSLPPFVYCENSYVYFHSEYYSCKPKLCNTDKSTYEKIKSYIYYFWINSFKKNVNSFFCQTSLVENNLKQTYSLEPIILPFYSLPIVPENEQFCKEYDFFYPAIGTKHKNHILLFKAFEKLLSRKKAVLAVTISDRFCHLFPYIDKVNAKYPHSIINLGYCNEEQIGIAYMKSKALIFPSTMESFGLPLIEALSMGLKVITSDFDYSYKVISDPIVFNPYNWGDIAAVMENFIVGVYKDVNQKVLVENKIGLLINLLNK
ncbi:glycosyltransferase [Bacteroides rodentium]|uniref:glycosyltransferase n=1 Tax=Bacteroides rodentium TaxID=691816 RepID=UPI00046F2828|nr:glycosyltransferase [Bacteroides rodentium]